MEFNFDGVWWAIYLTVINNFFLLIKLHHEKKGQLLMLWIHQDFTEKEHTAKYGLKYSILSLNSV